VKPKLRRQLQRGKQKILQRLAPLIGGTEPRQHGTPEFHGPQPTYEVAERTAAVGCGGLGVIHRLVRQIGLPQLLDSQLDILKRARPYQDSDHVLNIAYNLLCGGHVLEDIELRRNDTAFLDLLGARAIPDPTTAGDFCRRFDSAAIWRLMDVFNEARLGVWKASGEAFFRETARIDVDGTLVPTTGECKQGMDLSHKGVWGYHPLVVSLANTGEPLFIVNRGGNRPSHDGAPEVIDQAIALCRRAGFKDVLLRGDTDFSMSAHLDRWDEAGVRFVLGHDANPPFVRRADGLHPGEFAELCRKADAVFSSKRAKPHRFKEEIVRARGYLNKRLVAEDTAEFEHKPHRAKRSYRIVVLRKLIEEERGQLSVGTNFRYFFYVTNDRSLSQQEVVAESNNRCNQENLNAQLKGSRALRAPLNTLDSNWAYMVIASLAWTLKAWLALLLPVDPRQREQHQADRTRVLRMEFRSFLQRFILIPAQIALHARSLTVRLLAWRPELPLIFRFLDGW
jgi:hypothetical protein